MLGLISLAVATVFTVTLELEHITRLWGTILLITLIITFSILIASSLITVRIKNSIEKLKAPDSLMENIFDLATSAQTFKILIPVVGVILVFFGWNSWKNLKEDIITQIDPQKNIEIMKALIDSSRTLQDKLKNYELPIGTIVAFDGSQKLPPGWAPCDGDTIHITKDSVFVTPNLINRFVLGTTSSNPGTYLRKTIGDTGGANVHSHPLQFSLDVVTLPNQQASSNAYIKTAAQDEQRLPASHTHRINFNLIKETQQVENLPPYYALVFIIKYR